MPALVDAQDHFVGIHLQLDSLAHQVRNISDAQDVSGFQAVRVDGDGVDHVVGQGSVGDFREHALDESAGFIVVGRKDMNDTVHLLVFVENLEAQVQDLIADGIQGFFLDLYGNGLSFDVQGKPAAFAFSADKVSCGIFMYLNRDRFGQRAAEHNARNNPAASEFLCFYSKITFLNTNVFHFLSFW